MNESFLIFHTRWADAPVLVRLGAIVSISGDGDSFPASTRIALVNGDVIEAVESFDTVLSTIIGISARSES